MKPNRLKVVAVSNKKAIIQRGCRILIGTNREAVTRAMGDLQERGAIEVKARRLYVRDFGVLRRSAGE